MKYNFPALSALNYCDTLEYLDYSPSTDKMAFEFSNAQGKKYKLSIPSSGYRQGENCIYLEFRLSGEKISIEATRKRNWYSNIESRSYQDFHKAFNKVFNKVFTTTPN